MRILVKPLLSIAITILLQTGNISIVILIQTAD